MYLNVESLCYTPEMNRRLQSVLFPFLKRNKGSRERLDCIGAKGVCREERRREETPVTGSTTLSAPGAASVLQAVNAPCTQHKAGQKPLLKLRDRGLGRPSEGARRLTERLRGTGS